MGDADRPVKATGDTTRRGARPSGQGVPRSPRGIRLPEQTAAVLSIMGGLLLWELLGRYVVQNPLFLATPLQIGTELTRLLQTGELQTHIWASGQAFFVGLFISIILGIAIGVVIAVSPLANRVLNPWVTALYATPTIAVAPLIILWFGIDLWAKVVVVVINAIFPMIINTESGLRATDRRLLEAVRCFGANRAHLFFYVMLPSAIPYILAGVRLAVGRAIVSVVVAELFGSRAGLGFMLVQASEIFNMPRLFSAVVVLALLGIALTALARWLEANLQPWNKA